MLLLQSCEHEHVLCERASTRSLQNETNNNNCSKEIQLNIAFTASKVFVCFFFASIRFNYFKIVSI